MIMVSYKRKRVHSIKKSVLADSQQNNHIVMWQRISLSIRLILWIMI